MSSPTSENTVASKLAEQILNELRISVDAERNLTQLYNATEAESLDVLGSVLLLLLNEGEIEFVYRVLGPDGEGIEDFKNPLEVPPEMPDPTGEPGSKFLVGSRDIDVIYRASEDRHADADARR